jgi:hypothetical protein
MRAQSITAPPPRPSARASFTASGTAMPTLLN